MVLNLFRFIGLESSPPGFYVDEAAGAAQVLCLKQTGSDFFGHAHPLFSEGLGGGYYTAPYLYGELVWTSLFGNSIYAFRAFMALIPTATIYFLYDWLKKRANARVAMLAVLFASISPWAFQFSRIAWDPPLAPFFLILGLWFFDLKKSGNLILGALAIALAGYSYPPCRIQVVILLFALPGMSWKKKFQVFGIFALANIPLLYQAWSDPAFTSRAKMLAITSDYSMNPYRGAGVFGLGLAFIWQFLQHFNPDFLFFHGDHNLRHSIQQVGELSYPEGLVLLAGLVYFLAQTVRQKKLRLEPPFVFAAIGIASGITPAALTWESVPHALRSIGAWPFFAILAALTADRLMKQFATGSTREALFRRVGWGASMLFAIFYLRLFFFDYPAQAVPWFQDDQSPLGSAYRKMNDSGLSCEALRNLVNH